MQRVHEILKHKGSHVYSITPGDTVFNAIDRMADKEIGALLVMEEQQAVGIVSERDYTRKVILKDKSSKQTQVADIMSSDLVTVDPEERVEAGIA